MCGDSFLRGSDQMCPRCGGRDVHVDREMEVGGHGPGIAACARCAITWEIFKADDLLDEQPLSSFKSPCNNCAFRKDSPERADPYKWMHISENVDGGIPFYCHKGVPITPNVHNGFDYPMRSAVAEFGAENVALQVPDSKKLRLCRGWLNSRYARVRRANDRCVASAQRSHESNPRGSR